MSTATLATARLKYKHDAATDLCRHLQQCRLARGRWFGAAMLAEEVHRLVAPRFATTVALSVVVIVVACAWL